MTLRLLAVHAHPDDESSKGAATYASYVARGAQVMVVSCTGGEAGSILNTSLHARSHAERDLTGLRRLEMSQAQRILGVEHRWLGYRDSGMPEDGVFEAGTFASIPLQVSVRPLIRLIREFRPHVLVTYDENGGYPHPDHIRTHEVSMLAWSLSGAKRYEELGEPWNPLKLYYDRTMNDQRAKSMSQLLTDHPEVHLSERVQGMLDRLLQQRVNVTTQIPIAEHFATRDAALRAHASQVDPNNDFFFGYPRDLELQAYPYDGYELVATRVAATLPETDLFHGIRDEEQPVVAEKAEA